MFFLVTALICTNIYLIPYYFTSQFEYFIIECLIPFLNNIYLNKGQKRIIEVKIFNETNNEPINLNQLHYEENNKPSEDNGNNQSSEDDEQYLSYNEINFNQPKPSNDNQNTDINLTESSGELVEKINESDETEDESDDESDDELFNKNIVGVFHETITNLMNNSKSTDNDEVTSDSIFVEMVE